MSKLAGKLVIGPWVFYILAGGAVETEALRRASGWLRSFATVTEESMKPLQIAILVAISGVAGGLFMKWQISRNVANVGVAAAPVAQPAQQAPVEPVAVPSPPALTPRPSPLAEPKALKPTEKAHEVRKARRSRPVMVAPSQEPAVEALPVAVAAVPAVALPQETVPLVQLQQPPAAEQPQPAVAAPSPQPPSPPPLQVTLKAGTLIPVRTVERLSSDRNSAGDGFTATLDQPLVVEGWVIAERGARLEGKVVDAQRGGHATGSSDLAIVLTQLKTSDGQRIAIETETFEKHAQASTGETAGKVIAGTAIGAAIGAMAGGGKGAGIGAAVGTAAGAGGAAATRNKAVTLPPETRIDFRLRNSITITERQGAKS
jgi:hypothetical protein